MTKTNYLDLRFVRLIINNMNNGVLKRRKFSLSFVSLTGVLKFENINNFEDYLRKLHIKIKNIWKEYKKYLLTKNKTIDIEFLKTKLKIQDNIKIAPKTYYQNELKKSLQFFIKSSKFPSKLLNPQKTKFSHHFLTNYDHIHQIKSILQVDPFKILAKKQHFLNPSKEKPLLLLDLDETLMHSGTSKKFLYNTKIKFLMLNGEEADLGINFRPFLFESLYLLNQIFELGIFTASRKSYADQILNLIDPNSELFKIRLYRKNCIPISHEYFLKDLRVIGNRPLDKVYLVDNNSYFFANNLENGIPIVSFFNDFNDTELIHLSFFLIYFQSIKCNEIRANLLKSHFKNFLYLEDYLLRDILKILA
jgi:Dullard-like phosphatase family protein